MNHNAMIELSTKRMRTPNKETATVPKTNVSDLVEIDHNAVKNNTKRCKEEIESVIAEVEGLQI